jgi:hypothetical protein
MLSLLYTFKIRFPPDHVTFVQHSLINILLSKSPASILFLDRIWEMYQMPFSTVFNNWNPQLSKAKINASLLEFEKKYVSHVFVTPGSLAYRKLDYLSRLITEWIENSNKDFTVPDMVSQAANTFIKIYSYFNSLSRIPLIPCYKLIIHFQVR